MRRALIFALCAGLLCGCAAPKSSLITADTALISVTGKTADARSDLLNASLLEAARITQAQGYRYFVVLDTADASTVERKLVPPAHLRGEGVTGVLTFQERRKSQAQAGMQTPVGEIVPYIRPGLDMTIRMYREGEVDPKMDGVFNPDALLSMSTRSG